MDKQQWFGKDNLLFRKNDSVYIEASHGEKPLFLLSQTHINGSFHQHQKKNRPF